VSDGFVDLRLNRQEGQVNESFWPSFTDIMTVVVMIFLIAMVILLMRNMDLVRQLRATMEAERQAMELARATGQEKEGLAFRLHQAEDRLNQLQLEVMRLQEEKQRRGTVIEQQKSELVQIRQEREELSRQATTLLEEQRQLISRVEDERRQRTLAEREVSDLRQRTMNLDQLSQSQAQQIASLQQDLQTQQTELEAMRVQRQDTEQRYLSLTDQYDDLKVKYNKLIRPARSPQGHHLVEVRYWKEGGALRLAWRDDGQGNFVDIDRSALEAQLNALKQARPEGLYVKVIFPENSGLSYNEAWELTNNLHQAYDYYFQEEQAEPSAQSGP